MKNRLNKRLIEAVKKYIRLSAGFYKTNQLKIKKAAALSLSFGGVAAISFVLGWKTGHQPESDSAHEVYPVVDDVVSSGSTGTLAGTPSYVFPSYATDSQATPSNVELMGTDVLNLAYLYEDGADIEDSSDSYAGRLYQKLVSMDAEWISGIYDLFNYTPDRIASQFGLSAQSVTAPDGTVPKFSNIHIQFTDGNGSPAGSYSNSKEIVSMANTLYYYGVLQDMDSLERYVSGLWKNSHSCFVRAGGIYYCDGNCMNAQSGSRGESTRNAVSESTEAELETETSEPDKVGLSFAKTPDASNAPSGEEDKSGEHDASAAKAPDTEADSEETSVGGLNQMTATSNTAGKKVSSKTYTSGRSCPGHIDFTVSVVVKGLTETGGLCKLDSIPVSQPGESAGWAGWDSASTASALELSRQDWFEQYGINTTDLALRTPLTSAEIDLYMSMVPQNASQTRKDFIKYALASVGKIPYYWGGKPQAPGYGGNHFGTVVSPDVDGRFLKGLDCSGWINWVYWSVMGKGLGAESTSTLLSSGKAISKDQLQPGDICIRTGSMAHVVIFLGWGEDGKTLCIQETSGNINNVEVGINDSEWQSFRRIID